MTKDILELRKEGVPNIIFFFFFPTIFKATKQETFNYNLEKVYLSH